MKGFDDKALILFPKLENYSNKPSNYKYQFKQAVNNLVTYFKDRGIQPYAFYTDDIAREMRHPDIMFISPLGDSDNFFIQKYCDNAKDALTLQMLHYPAVENEVIAKDPVLPKMGVEEHFELVVRHINKSTAKIIPMYNIVVHFAVPKRAQYKVTSKPGDGKIRVNVSANTFIPKVYMSGNEEDPCDVFGTGYANRCLDSWEVRHE